MNKPTTMFEFWKLFEDELERALTKHPGKFNDDHRSLGASRVTDMMFLKVRQHRMRSINLDSYIWARVARVLHVKNSYVSWEAYFATLTRQAA